MYALEELFRSISNSLVKVMREQERERQREREREISSPFSHLIIFFFIFPSQDGLIHKDELSTALFGAPAGGSLLTDRIFSAFDTAANDVIDFPEFVRGLSAFHPAAPPDAKADFSFRMYDLGRTGAIEPGEVRRLLGGLVRDNPALSLSDADVEALVDAAMADADAAGDGVIHPHEWRALVSRCPAVAAFMTLPALANVTTKYPSFVLRSRH